MNRDEALQLLHAYLDGELDPAKSVELEAHLATDPAARAASDRLRALSASIRDQADYHTAPAAFEERLRAALPAPSGEHRRAAPRRAWLAPGVAFVSAAVLAAGVTWFATRPDASEPLAREALASHVRATLGSKLADVASSDQHTVKPWLSARLPYSPPVADFSAHGFELTGARLDYVGRRPVAVLVYQRRKHMIDVFVWPEAGEAAPRTSVRDGFNLERFAREGMRYWLVSDLNRNELDDLARLLGAR